MTAVTYWYEYLVLLVAGMVIDIISRRHHTCSNSGSSRSSSCSGVWMLVVCVICGLGHHRAGLLPISEPFARTRNQRELLSWSLPMVPIFASEGLMVSLHATPTNGEWREQYGLAV